MPFFSIIIPTYNRAHLISKAVESVKDQTYKDWELIIVDDGSTDQTKSLVEEYYKANSRIRYIYQENAERSAARNNGIDNANGKYICFLDSDDYYLKERLKGLFDYIQMEKEPKHFYYTAITYDYNGRLEERQERMRDKENVFEFLVQAIIGTPQVILSKEILTKERFDTRWRIGEDMELWLRLARFEEPRFIENQATVVAVDHAERSVGIGNLIAYQKQLETIKYIKYLGHPVSKQVIQKKIHGILMSILRCHYHKREKWKFFQIFFLTFSYSITESFKEKLIMLIKLK